MVGHTCRCYQGKALQAPDKQTSCEWGGVVVAVSYQMSQLWQSKEGREGRKLREGSSEEGGSQEGQKPQRLQEGAGIELVSRSHSKPSEATLEHCGYCC